MNFSMGLRVREWGTSIALTLLILTIPMVPPASAGELANGLPGPIDVFRPALKAATAPCSLNNNNHTAMAYLSTIMPGDRFGSFMNPANCQEVNAYPMSIYWVSLPLYHFTGAHWPVGAKIQIYGMKGADSCSGPGELLYTFHQLLDSETFAAPHVGVVALPDPVCVTGPFYVVFEYDGSTPQPYPSVLFDTQVPGNPCVNWVYRAQWVPWDQFWLPPGAGNFMVWVDGYSQSNVCATDEPSVQSITSLFNNFPSLVGTRVTTLGYYTGADDGKLVDSYADFLKNVPLPFHSSVDLVGPLADSTYNATLSTVTGYLYAERNPCPYYPNDTVTLKLYPSKWTRIVGAPLYPSASADTMQVIAPEPGCDSTRFVVLMGGGVNESNSHIRYWNELAAAYRFYLYGYMVCPQNLSVLYHDGVARDGSVLPPSTVDSMTLSRLQATLVSISHQIANCVRRGRNSDLHVYISGQGSAQGVLTFGGQVLSASSLRAMLQPVLDSGCGQLYVDFSGSFTGPVSDSLKELKKGIYSTLSMGTAAGNDVSYSGAGHSAYARYKIDPIWGLIGFLGYPDLETEYYFAFLDSLSQSWLQFSDTARAWLLANPPGSVTDSIRGKVVADTAQVLAAYSQLSTMRATSSARPRFWLRFGNMQYGNWHSVASIPNGQAVFTFAGDTSFTGNVTLYKDTLVNSSYMYKKAAVWTWNIPGSKGYVSGNDRRVINSDAMPATGFYVHNDSREYTITADMLTDRPNVESPSNPYDCAGFSVGTLGPYDTEFGLSSFVGPYQVNNAELPGLRLDSFPSVVGGAQVDVHYSIPVQTQYWNDMDFYISISAPAVPGQMNMFVSGAQDSNFAVAVSGPGKFSIHLGAIAGTGTHTVSFLPSAYTHNLDYFALRSRIAESPSCCVGTTGNVNGVGIVDLSDLSTLVSYLTGGPATLACWDEANVNGVGIVDLSDLSYLVSYLTGGSVVLPSCP